MTLFLFNVQLRNKYDDDDDSALRIVKTYLRSSMGQQRVSNIALIHIERAYANFVLENDIEHIIDIFGSRTGRDSYFF